MAVFREEQIENGARRVGIGIGERVIYIGISALRIANNQSSLFPLLSQPVFEDFSCLIATSIALNQRGSVAETANISVDRLAWQMDSRADNGNGYDDIVTLLRIENDY